MVVSRRSRASTTRRSSCTISPQTKLCGTTLTTYVFTSRFLIDCLTELHGHGQDVIAHVPPHWRDGVTQERGDRHAGAVSRVEVDLCLSMYVSLMGVFLCLCRQSRWIRVSVRRLLREPVFVRSSRSVSTLRSVRWRTLCTVNLIYQHLLFLSVTRSSRYSLSSCVDIYPSAAIRTDLACHQFSHTFKVITIALFQAQEQHIHSSETKLGHQSVSQSVR